MWFLAFYLFLALLVWIICLQTQVNKLSGIVNLLNRRVSELIYSKQNQKQAESVQKPEIHTETIQPEIKPQSVVQEQTPVKPAEVITPQPQINSAAYTPQTNSYTTLKKQNQGSDFQNAFLGNIFNKIGALAIIVALIIFIKLISPFIVLTPVMKLVLGYLSGLVLSVTAIFMHKKEKLQNYSEVLLGTGFATLYISTYCACPLLKVFNETTSIVVGLFIMIAAYIISERMKTVSMLVIGLIGAYLTPLITQVQAPVLYTNLIFINMFSIVFALRNKNSKVINIVNLVVTLLIFSISHLSGKDINITFPILLWGMYLIYDLLRERDNQLDNVTGWLNYVILTIFSIWIFNNAHTQLGWLVLSTAGMYGILSLILKSKNNDLYKSYNYSILINIWLYIYFTFNDVYSVISWAIIGLLLTYFITVRKSAYLKYAVVGYYMTAFAGTLLAEYNGVNCFSATYSAIWNVRTLIFAPVALSMLLAAKAFKKCDDKYYHFLLMCGLSLSYLYVIGEINSIIPSGFGKALLYVIIGFMYSLQCKRIAVMRKSVLFDVLSYITGIISTIGLICWSYTYPAEYVVIFNLRVAAYLLAIIACMLSAKWTGKSAYKYIAVILGFLLCHTEAAGIVKTSGSMEYLISLSWVLYSGIVTISGILRDKKFLTNTGIVLSILTTLRIFLYDLANVDMIYKLIAFFALGIILMLVSYIYTVHNK